MESGNKKTITVENTVNAPVARVWKLWNEPEHIQNWCHASDDWHAPYAENDLKINGRFKTTMAARDNSFSFDFEGVYTNIQENQLIEYTIGDGRRVAIKFIDEDNQTKVIETFEMESLHPEEMQRSGWQAIMDNFKNYAESIA